MQYPGTYSGYVVNNKDPYQMGRVRVRVPAAYGPTAGVDGSISDGDLPWALPSGLPAGETSGSGGGSWIPNVGDRVFVRFLDGEPEKPVWEWGSQQKPDLDVEEKDRFVKDFYETQNGSSTPKAQSGFTKYGHVWWFHPTDITFSTQKGYSIVATDASSIALDGRIDIRTPLGNSIAVTDETGLDPRSGSVEVYSNNAFQAKFDDLFFTGTAYLMKALTTYTVEAQVQSTIASSARVDIKAPVLYTTGRTPVTKPEVPSNLADAWLSASLTAEEKVVLQQSWVAQQQAISNDLTPFEMWHVIGVNTDWRISANHMLTAGNIYETVEALYSTATSNREMVCSEGYGLTSNSYFGAVASDYVLEVGSSTLISSGSTMVIQVGGRTLNISSAGFVFS